MPNGGDDWVEYRDMGVRCKSDIIYLNVLGTSIVILNSSEAINDLLEKRSAIYSSRPRMVMLSEVMGYGGAFGTMPYGSYWRSHRRLFHSEFEAEGKGAIWHHPHLKRGVSDLLRNLLESPDRWETHLRQQMGATILEVAYGIRALPENDPHIRAAETTMKHVADGGTPGRYLVDTIPWLKYVPAWFPGASFQKVGQEARKANIASFKFPFDEVKNALANGNAKSSFTARCLENLDPNGDTAFEELVIQNTAGTIHGAASDATISTLSTFFLAMVKYPEAQARAQQELDSVIGPNHLPSFADRDSLPYISAIMKECLRWEVSLPFSIPHQSTEDDVYNGYHIPAGTLILPNSWAVFNDESVYPDPRKFNPDRYLTEDGKLDPSVKDPDAAWGYGRRACPGRHMGWDSVWLTAASILACFKIGKSVDSHGNVVEPSGKYIANAIRRTEPFLCSIKPRSKEMENIIGHL
ncbi:cytochrome P450 [Athelia psychrophila]|uniref:Cytochrome P450 n=1 Tax=Athelia psychrophila TaxID=1759441 RepID=A0A165ZHQ4_9AGAM|nr:cytochrome P450 [Fibularhizoctonia sp. CBS 109695]